MKMNFGQYDEGFGAEILCPKCNGNYTHHEKIDVFERDEDEVKGLHAKIQAKNIEISNELIGNPSRRRNGLTVEFRCETCAAFFALTISQHKGNSLLDIVLI